MTLTTDTRSPLADEYNLSTMTDLLAVTAEQLTAAGVTSFEATPAFEMAVKDAVETAFIRIAPTPIISDALSEAIAGAAGKTGATFDESDEPSIEDDVIPFLARSLEVHHQQAIENGYSTAAELYWVGE